MAIALKNLIADAAECALRSATALAVRGCSEPKDQRFSCTICRKFHFGQPPGRNAIAFRDILAYIALATWLSGTL